MRRPEGPFQTPPGAGLRRAADPAWARSARRSALSASGYGFGLRSRFHENHDADGSGSRPTRRAAFRSPCARLVFAGRRAGRRVAWPAWRSVHRHFPGPGLVLRLWRGNNALLGKKCFALRIASVMARDEGWLAEHMLILKLTSAGRCSKFIDGVPDALPGQHGHAAADAGRLEGRDHRRCWMRFGDDGQLFGQSGGRLLRRGRHEQGDDEELVSPCADCIFTNVALTDDGDVWWAGADRRGSGAPDRLAWPRLDTGEPGARRASERALRLVPASQTPVIATEWKKTRPKVRQSPPSCPPTAAPARCRWSTRLATGRTACSWPPARGLRGHGGGNLHRRAAAATRSRCCRSAATTWATISPTGWR